MNWLPFIDEKYLGMNQSPEGGIAADKPGAREHFLDRLNCGFALILRKRD